jgi:aromatic-L-amino-acid/L-tryptophan decarboxylase
MDSMKEVMGFPLEASGLLVSGGSMANLVGLAVARQAAAGPAVRSEGLRGLERQMTVYASAETHSSVQKAVELLGLGSRFLRKIPVNEQYQVDVTALRAAIQADRQAFLQPICVVGNAGTVNTGAIDDLEALADICQAEGLWFHVDGAIGALARLAPSLLPALAGVRRADSVAFDLHKWLYLPFEIGGVLVRSADLHHDTFALMPAYLARSGERGLSSGASWFSEFGVQLSRGFRALKAWMSIKEQGAARFGRLMEQNVAQAQYLAARVQETPALELCAPVPLNIVCFRYTSPGLDEPALNALNQELLIRLHESGLAVPTYTTLNGRYMLRAAITNHRSRREDFDLLVEAVVNLGNELVREGAGG